MAGKMYGLVALIIGLAFLAPAVRDMQRGYSVTYVRRGIAEFEPAKPFGNTRISKPPELGYYLWIGGASCLGTAFTLLGLALLITPTRRAEARKKRKHLHKGVTGPDSGEEFIKDEARIRNSEEE